MIVPWVALALVLAGEGGDGVDDDALVIVDAPPAERSPWTFTGRGLALVAADLTAEEDEDTLATLVDVQLALAFEPTPTWDARVHVRLRHELGVRPGDARQALTLDPIEARLAWRPTAGPEITAGWVADLRWPELASPHPLDLALGPRAPTGEPGDRRRAIPALHVAHALGAARVELLWQPIEVAMRVPLAGSDWAPVTLTGVDALADIAPVDGLAGGSAGARARVTLGRGEVGVTWLWRVDPVPAARGASRQHRLTLDARLATGPLGWRGEVAWVDRTNAWTVARAPTSSPTVEGRVSVAWAPLVLLDLELGLDALHALDAGARRWLGAGPDDVDLRARVGLLLAWDGVARLDLEGRLGLLRPDGDVALALALRASAWDEVAIGLTVFEGAAVAGGLGALYDADDALWLRWTRAW